MYGGERITNYKWAHLGSNQGPIPYEGTALTTELWALAECIIAHLLPHGKRKIPDFSNCKVAVTLACINYRARYVIATYSLRVYAQFPK
jgi:hypothetical protein